MSKDKSILTIFADYIEIAFDKLDEGSIELILLVKDDGEIVVRGYAPELPAASMS